MTSTLTNDGYKPQPILLGGAEMVLISVIVCEFSQPSLCTGGRWQVEQGCPPSVM